MSPPHALFRHEDIITGSFAYARWLGDRYKIEEMTTTWDETVIDRGDALREWVVPINDLLKKEVPVYGYFNNHYSGHAPADVAMFSEMLLKDSVG